MSRGSSRATRGPTSGSGLERLDGRGDRRSFGTRVPRPSPASGRWTCAVTPEVLAGVLRRVYPQMLQEASTHQDAGRPAYVVTAASKELAEMMAGVLMFDGGLGNRSEVVDGVYTGRPDGQFTYREGKAAAIRDAGGAGGASTWRESYAYSDSVGPADAPTGGKPGGGESGHRARAQVAREEGWRIIHFDKLARRLRLAAAAAGLALVGGGGGYLAARLRAGRRWR